jgi:hypothetical protein
MVVVLLFFTAFIRHARYVVVCACQNNWMDLITLSAC